MSCPICNDRLHVKTAKGWRRCECSKKVVSDLYIKKNIKCGEDRYPATLDGRKPLDLVDLLFPLWDYNQFRHLVWYSLHYYENADIRYDYLDAYRLVEIFLSQDQEYSRIRDLGDLGLVVLVLGVADAPNRMLPSLVCQLITQRKMNGLPTWVFLPLQGSQARVVYGNQMADLLTSSMKTVEMERTPSKSNYVD